MAVITVKSKIVNYRRRRLFDYTRNGFITKSFGFFKRYLKVIHKWGICRCDGRENI